MDTLRFVVVGVGGYALVHLEAINWLHEQGQANLVGLVALKEDQQKYAELIQSLTRKGVTIYSNVDEFFATGARNADVLTLPIGTHMHVPVGKAALRAGLHVYCEKPLAATVQEVDELIAVRNQTGRKIAVGFQHIYSFSMQELKARICDGRLGRVQEISLMCGWPRSQQYYTRNDWAGRMRKDGNWILDSPANNAHAHYLLNMLYLCGAEPSKAATPMAVHAELYRANQIDSPDTVQVDFKAEEGGRGHAVFSHCNASELGPVMQIRCAKGDVKWAEDIGKTVINYNDGKQEAFDNLTHPQWRYDGFKNLVQAINEDTAPICSLEMARCHTLTVNAIHESCPAIKQIPESEILQIEDWEMFPPDTKGHFRRVENMDAYLQAAFEKKKFLSELKITWAQDVRSQPFAIRDYSYFPSTVKPHALIV